MHPRVVVFPVLDRLPEHFARIGEALRGSRLRIGRESAAGLAAAHRHGLPHCDLKPGNLWLEDPAGRVKLLDFGLAVPVSDDGPEPVGGSGTPGYLAPEQVQHGPLDPRTDVFGLGCVLYQMATGRLPFTGPAAMRVYWTAMGATPPALAQSTVRPDLPERRMEPK